VAAERDVPLYQHFAGVSGRLSPLRLPRLTVNLFSGGKHAGQHLAIQDVLVVPVSPTTIDDSLAMVYAVYDAAGRIVRQKYGQRLLRADEGGLSPPARSTAELLDDAMDAIRNAGLEPGRDVALAVDVAATHFCSEGLYHIDGQALTSGQMIELLKGWSRRYPILSFEDGLAEEDWKHWPDLVQAFAPQGKDVADVSPAPAAGGGTSRVAVMGDDLLCTHPARIRHAIAVRAADALLLKVNQIGTLTEAAEALRHARSARWQVTVSARSGETEDDWLADLAVGFAADYVKIGSITQSERLAKYNRLLEIEREAGLPLAPLPA
jgi:enolase